MNATQIIIIVVALLVIKLIQVLMKMKYQKQTPLSAIFGRFAKLAMLFKGSGIKIDENAHLSEEELRKYSLGNLYAYQQQGTLNTFSTGVGASVREIILGEYFGIKDRDSAVECLQWLVQAPSQMTFQYAFAALQEGGGKASQDWIYANEELKEHTDFREECLSKLEKLEEHRADIINNGVAASEEEIGRLGVLAWDAGRLNFIGRLCFEQKYISESECMECINAAYEMTKDAYSGWRDYAHSYVLGRTLSMGSTNMIGLANDLLTNPKSPWNYIKW